MSHDLHIHPVTTHEKTNINWFPHDKTEPRPVVPDLFHSVAPDQYIIISMTRSVIVIFSKSVITSYE